MNDNKNYNNDDEKIQRIRELSEQIITNSSQAKAMLLALIVEGDFTSLDAHTQHDYLCVLDDKVTTAMNLHKGITMLCG